MIYSVTLRGDRSSNSAAMPQDPVSGLQWWPAFLRSGAFNVGLMGSESTLRQLYAILGAFWRISIHLCIVCV